MANYSEIQLSTVNGVDLAFMKTLQWRGERISSLTWSGEQGVLASSAGSGDIRIWNVETGESLAEIKEHREPAGYLSFSPDGELFASGSNDNTIKIWDWRNHRCIQTLTAHKDQVYGLQFSPLGGYSHPAVVIMLPSCGNLRLTKKSHHSDKSASSEVTPPLSQA